MTEGKVVDLATHRRRRTIVRMIPEPQNRFEQTVFDTWSRYQDGTGDLEHVLDAIIAWSAVAYTTETAAASLVGRAIVLIRRVNKDMRPLIVLQELRKLVRGKPRA